MSDKLRVLKEAERNLGECIKWHALGEKETRNGVLCGISSAHCEGKIKLVRAGQFSTGGKNYWDSPQALNDEIKEYVIVNFNEIYPELLKSLESKRSAALQDCQSFIDEMQRAINDDK